MVGETGGGKKAHVVVNMLMLGWNHGVYSHNKHTFLRGGMKEVQYTHNLQTVSCEGHRGKKVPEPYSCADMCAVTVAEI